MCIDFCNAHVHRDIMHTLYSPLTILQLNSCEPGQSPERGLSKTSNATIASCDLTLSKSGMCQSMSGQSLHSLCFWPLYGRASHSLQPLCNFLKELSRKRRQNFGPKVCALKNQEWILALSHVPLHYRNL